MTEIPEHLLKRSQERRQAAAGTGGAAPPGATGAGSPEAAEVGTPEGQPTDSAAPTTSPAVPAAAAAPARRGPTEPAAPPPPPKPLPPYVLAAQSRKRVPFWAVPVLAGLPIWVFIYMEAMSPVKAQPTGALAVGAQVYNTCSACHGSGGEGGTGYKLSEGEVLKNEGRQRLDGNRGVHVFDQSKGDAALGVMLVGARYASPDSVQ